MTGVAGLLALGGSALLLSAASSLHCAGMCGAFAVVARSGAAWHVGKGLSYMVLGAVAGALGGAALPAGGALVVAIVSSVILVVAAAQLAGLVPRAVGASNGAGWLSRSLRAVAAAEGRSLHVRRLLFGVANGFVPCGLVYAGLAIAAVGGSAAAGAGVMAAFALGTAPVLAAIGLGTQRVTRWARRPGLRLAAAAFALAIGLGSVWTRVPMAAAAHGPDAVHGRHCEHGDHPGGHRTADALEPSCH